jgi:glyoxylase-like metal-dependent hydrolase (beta-lactamase superfamily II)
MQCRLWQTISMPQLTLGDFELSIFSDGTYPLDGGAFFGVIPKVMWSRKAASDERNHVQSGLNSLLIRTSKQNVLVETGIGNKLSERMIKFYGQPAQLLANLAAGGIAPEDIDIVINTHLHFDHCGWNTIRNKDGKIVPTFPRAKYYAPEGEWQYSRNPSERDSISYISDNYDPLVQSGQMTLLKGGEQIIPGITVKTFPGHTAHMQAVIVRGKAIEATGTGIEEVGQSFAVTRERIRKIEAKALRKLRYKPRTLESGIGHGKGTTSVVPSAASFERARLPAAPSESEKGTGALAPEVACYISDLIPTTAHIDIAWGMAFDLYPLQTIESKKQYYAKAIPEKWLTVFTHDAKTPWAYVEKDESGKMVVRSA